MKVKQRHQVVTFTIAVLFPQVLPPPEFTSELEWPVDPNCVCACVSVKNVNIKVV